MTATPQQVSYAGHPVRSAWNAVRLELARDPYRRLVALLLIISISRIHQHFGFLRPVRPALALTLLAVAYAYMNPRFLATGSIFRTREAKLILAMAIMACLSVPFGISMGASGRFIIEDYSKVLLFTFLVVAGIRCTRDLYTFIWAFVASIGFLSYLSLFVFRMSKATADGFTRIQNGYSYDANDIGTVAVIGIPLTLLVLGQARGKKKLVAGAILLGIGGTIAKTGSRGAFLGLMAVGLALLLMLTSVPVGKRLVFMAAVGIGLAFFAPPGYWTQMKTLLSPKEDYNWSSPTGRREVFKRGIGYMMRNPITGIGIENFAKAEGTISDRAIAQARDPNLPGIKWSAAHNSFLQTAAEMGLPGVVIFASIVVLGVVGPIKLRKRRIPPEWSQGDDEERFLYFTSVYLPVAFIGFAVAGFFVSFAYMDLVYVLTAFSIGLAFSVEVKLQQSQGMHPVGGTADLTVSAVPRHRGGLPPVPPQDLPGPRFAPR